MSKRELTVCGGTDVGVHREQNQDAFAIVDLASGRVSRSCVRTEVSVEQPGLLLVVCDGMGGPPAGDVAARVAATTIKDELAAAKDEVVAEPTVALERAVHGANDAILQEADAHPEERGMGTTCTAAVFSPEGVSVAQVGDSRAYLFREGKLFPLTRDQTMAEQFVDRGILRQSQVNGFPFRHVLSQALGTKPGVKPVMTSVDLKQSDRIVICSDGLHGPVDEAAISTILSATPEPREATQRLIEAALGAGGPDNVTVVVADCGRLSDN
ncbi:MAG TPA: protein phosphatase 2C domain-containing protein [Polyangia bacterium]|nr:protein phosphatase 2C domain-containing protein [Polyangia bacterium]